MKCGRQRTSTLQCLPSPHDAVYLSHQPCSAPSAGGLGVGCGAGPSRSSVMQQRSARKSWTVSHASAPRLWRRPCTTFVCSIATPDGSTWRHHALHLKPKTLCRQYGASSGDTSASPSGTAQQPSVPLSLATQTSEQPRCHSDAFILWKNFFPSCVPRSRLISTFPFTTHMFFPS